MTYFVRKKRLEFRPTTGNGPCRRSRTGDVNRRILATFKRGGVEYRYHATKGWRRVAA